MTTRRKGPVMIRDLILRNRSYRRFDQSAAISRETLVELVELARFSASGSNKQPLKFMLVRDAATNAKVFPHLAWAGHLEDWDGPAEGERPSGYVIILGDKQVAPNAGVDHGIAAQSMLLGAVEKGLGGCMIGSIQRQALREALNIDPQYDILLVIALGKPAEKVVIDDMSPGGSTAYYRDGDDVHHVPKRMVDELIVL